jgi:HEAT repeats
VSCDRFLRRFSSIFILLLGCTLEITPARVAFGQIPSWQRVSPPNATRVGIIGEKSMTTETPNPSAISLSWKSLLPPEKPIPRWLWLIAGAGAIILTASFLFHWKKRTKSIAPGSDLDPSTQPEHPDEAIDPEARLDPSAIATEDEPELQNPTPMRRIGIVETLIQDLHSRDPAKRRQAIWELGQCGDSRAIQPLVDLTLDSDSAQRSLILAALSEIGVRTLKPMNRALAVSLQDENPEVRKNAIRDLTRVYDLMTQVTQLLNHASEDGDREVSETARWAIGKLDRIRTLAGRDLSALPASEPPDEPI